MIFENRAEVKGIIIDISIDVRRQHMIHNKQQTRLEWFRNKLFYWLKILEITVFLNHVKRSYLTLYSKFNEFG